MILPFIISYAEIHYHFKYLRPLYFRKHPELIADIPLRVIKARADHLPVLIICKDAHLYPVEITKITIRIYSGELLREDMIEMNKKIEEKYFSTILKVSLNNLPVDQFYSVEVLFEYKVKGRKFQARNDNYKHLNTGRFRFYHASEVLPFPEGWFAGDVHYHSNYPHDQVEFGADLEAAKEFSRIMGLSWFFVTDHSYDLDNSRNSWTKNDNRLPCWHEMKEECTRLSDSQVRIVAGEEVSIGSRKSRNVHLIALNTDYIEGDGDSAEVWFHSRPKHFLKEVRQWMKPDNLFIAAHPFDKVPFSQWLTLRRGTWEEEDLIDSGIKYLQIINGSRMDMIFRNIDKWTGLLLKGNRYYLLAGNDAHGNFNIVRQIKIPFISLFSARDQVFGRMFTSFHHDSSDPIAAIQAGRMIVSNGPFLDLTIRKDDRICHIGDTFTGTAGIVSFDSATTAEFGKISQLILFIGDLEGKKEFLIKNPENPLVIDLPERGYIRMSLLTERFGIALTNPIWIDRRS